jgi:hypothetical protein
MRKPESFTSVTIASKSAAGRAFDRASSGIIRSKRRKPRAGEPGFREYFRRTGCTQCSNHSLVCPTERTARRYIGVANDFVAVRSVLR